MAKFQEQRTKKKKAVQLYIRRINGIAYNYDMFKSYKVMEINALQ